MLGLLKVVKLEVKMEKALNLYKKLFWEIEGPYSHNSYYTVFL